MPKSNNVTEIDVRRRHRSALDQNKHPNPVCSPLDEIKERTAELGYYNFLSKSVNWATCKYAQMRPLTDSRWYWKGACEYMLANNVV